jgi:hypothetical protein
MYRSAPMPARSSIEHFAQLCALLDDGPASHAEALAAADADETRWQASCEAWLPRLAAGDAPELAVRFSRAYAIARHWHAGHLPLPSVPEAARVPGTPGVAPASSKELVLEIDADDTVPGSAPPGALDADVAAESAPPTAESAPPFTRVDMLLPPAPREPAAARDALPATTDPADATLESAQAAVALFAPRPAATGWRQRLARFDTQTGQPLPEPRWVDEPTPL